MLALSVWTCWHLSKTFAFVEQHRADTFAEEPCLHTDEGSCTCAVDIDFPPVLFLSSTYLSTL